MNFVDFHVGDWGTSTRLLSPLEKGVYIDLLMLYYSLERPLMRTECDRIARAYATDEKAALEYVLDRFFDFDGECYKHARCEKEIAVFREKSAKAAKSAKSRWEKVRQQSERNANAVQTQCEGNATQYPVPSTQEITTTKEKVEKEKAPRAPLVAMPAELPAEWEASALEARPDVDPRYVYGKIKAKYAGATTRKALTTWRREFLNWIGREFAKAPAHSPKPVKKFTDEYYLNSLNPDGSVNWGI